MTHYDRTYDVVPDKINQETLDKLIEAAQPETQERRNARRIAQNTLGLLWDRGTIALDNDWNYYIVEKSK